MKGKVMVGMSGGVDSSVAALLLLEQGYEVVGATFKLFDDHELLDGGESKCCSIDDVNDARFVCDTLGIPHYVLNYKNLFRHQVVDYFADAYLHGRTPNPCIACNRHIKFDAFLNKALSMGFGYIATGHYARITHDSDTGIFSLKKGLDPQKDQSYVLYNQTQYSLAHTLLPLGEYRKSDVRHLAEKNKLVVSRKPDSQDICFIPNGDYATFIEKYTNTNPAPGPFIDTNGNPIGQHSGYYHFTIGQRRGLGVGFGRRKYVVDINPKSNSVTLGDEKDAYCTEIYVTNVNYLNKEIIPRAIHCSVKLRYSQPEQPALLESMENGDVKSVFPSPQKKVAKGQSAVFYQGDIIIGGGEVN